MMHVMIEVTESALACNACLQVALGSGKALRVNVVVDLFYYQFENPYMVLLSKAVDLSLNLFSNYFFPVGIYMIASNLQICTRILNQLMCFLIKKIYLCVLLNLDW